MAAGDISTITARMVTLVSGLPEIGRVHDHEVWDRDDFHDLVVSTIAGEPVMRAWMIIGPTLADAQYLTQSTPANAILRRWQYQLLGIEGLDERGEHAFSTLRANLLRVMDVLDADRQMGGSAHRSDPSLVVEAPQLRLVLDRYACAYTVATKVIDTLSAP